MLLHGAQPASLLRPCRTRARPRRALQVRADASRKFGKGQELEASRLNAGRQLGSGSFGECYRGTLVNVDGEMEEVVLKRVRARVQGADEMHEAEHLINVLASRAASEAVAPFLGYTVVEKASGRLTKGLWLVWAYEGDKTLAYYLKRRDLERCLAADLGVEENQAVSTAMKQIFDCLLALHNVGIVHRDIKPANIVFDESERRFRLIDLGAAACLRTGTNYKPSETILDPCYCPPEEYVLPTDAPHLAATGTRLRTVMTPVLWTQHRPDCFDTYSAGIVLMQLSLPFLRTTSSLRTFNGALARCNHDLEEWRVKSGLPARQTAILDANDGAGWDLAASLLRPRTVVNDDNGGVKFVNTGRAPRLGASAALKHPFIRKAGVQTAPVSEPAASGSGGRNRGGSGGRNGSSSDRTGSRGSRGQRNNDVAAPAAVKSRASKSGRSGGKSSSGGGGLMGVWGSLKNRFFDLEARVMQEATATEVQTTRVQQLRSDVAAGRAAPADLEKEQSALEGMQKTLASSVKEMNSVYGAARGFLSGILGSGTGSSSAKAGSSGGNGRSRRGSGGKAAGGEEAAEPDRRMPKWAAKETSLERVDPAAARQASAARQQAEELEDGREMSEREAAAAASAAAEAAGVAAGAVVSSAASGLLRFTGSAITGLASFAVSVSEQMERNAQQAAAEAAAQKQAAAAFLEALQALEPALSGSSVWEEVAARLPPSADYEKLSERRQEQVFRAYVEVLARAESAARAKALAAFQELLVAAQVAADSQYSDFEEAHSSDPRYSALASESERQAAFEGFTGQLRAAREAAQRREAEAAESAARAAARAAQRLAEAQAAKERAAARAAAKAAETEAAEAVYRELLQEQESVIAGGVSYAQLKAMLWTDPRFDAVPEPRRKALHAEYVGILEEAGLLTVTVGEGDVAATVAGLQQLVDAEDGASQEQMEFLRREQARLKEEYARMEAKLRSMESRLQLGASPVAAELQHSEQLKDLKEEETVSFHFGDSLPPAAELQTSVSINGSKLAKTASATLCCDSSIVRSCLRPLRLPGCPPAAIG